MWPLLEVVDECLDEPWLARLAAHLGEPERRGAAGAAVRHRAPPRRAVRPLRAAPARRCARLGARRADATAPGGPGRRRGLAGRAVAAPARRGSARPGPPSGSRARARGCEADPALVDLPARFSLFGLTRLPAGHLRVLRALAAERDVHSVPAAPVAGAVGARQRPDGHAAAGRPPRRRIRPRRCRPTACSPPGATTRASCSSSSPRPASRPTTTTRSSTAAARCSRASRPTSRDGPGRRPAGRAARAPATAASRSTPATAARARSRSCATRSCTCSPRTRRSSRAT